MLVLGCDSRASGLWARGLAQGVGLQRCAILLAGCGLWLSGVDPGRGCVAFGSGVRTSGIRRTYVRMGVGDWLGAYVREARTSVGRAVGCGAVGSRARAEGSTLRQGWMAGGLCEV